VVTTRLLPLKHARTTVLDVAYVEAGPTEGPAVILLHGFPYDIHSYVDVVPALAESEEWERRLAEQPVIGVPAVTLDGLADGNFPATGRPSAAFQRAPRAATGCPAGGLSTAGVRSSG
jgi:hypothetical protein